MTEEIKKLGKFIKYTILPTGKTISFVVINDKDSFYDAVKQYNGTLENKDTKTLDSDPCFDSKFPNYDFSGKAKFYKLNNGLIGVDQSLSRKGNPYYICESYEDYELITKYLVVYRDDQTNEPIVECYLLSHVVIKSFLNSVVLTEVTEFDLPENTKLFKASNGYYATLDFLPAKSGAQALWSTFEKINDNEDIYIGLVIYESLELMKYLGVFEPDE